ncbi:hypothetical protein [uncultured Enterovirga sp.]|uniref:hypothetical protein n=1 Tax=uncultured Enterovirga sp. TaxID=2026352 RepID=UPI0035C9B5EC
MLIAFTVLAGIVIAIVAFTADNLTKREAAERIMAADEPCRAAFVKALDLRMGAEGKVAEFVEASRSGEATCRAAFKRLDEITIFIPGKGRGAEARERKTP